VLFATLIFPIAVAYIEPLTLATAEVELEVNPKTLAVVTQAELVVFTKLITVFVGNPTIMPSFLTIKTADCPLEVAVFVFK
jgi:hypothetical protein